MTSKDVPWHERLAKEIHTEDTTTARTSPDKATADKADDKGRPSPSAKPPGKKKSR